ncbi:peptidase M16, partial [Gemella sp. GH3]|uniref:peptidase M16 n=1 Tax=unclassified Gemella TaxID=2624949 RepID=UPI0015CF92E5
EDVYGYLQREKLQVSYSIIFKNVEDNYVDRIEELYKKQLEKILNEKFDKEQIQAIINKNNFIIKEETNKVSSPKGVTYAVRSLRNWLYNENPFDIFDYDYFISLLQNNLKENKYEDIACKYLLNNTQKSIVILRASNNKELEDDLTEYQASLNNDAIKEIIEETNQLIKWQNIVDKKTDLEKIKSIDAKKVNLKRPYKETVFEVIDSINYAHYDIETNDILYSKFLFDVTSFDKEQLQYASLISYLLFNINNKNQTELEVSKEIDFNLGDINSSMNILKNDKTNNIQIKFIISAKNLLEKINKLSDILVSNTLETDFSNKQNIYNICLELKLMLENRFKNASHSFISKRIASYNSLQNKILEYISGYDFYKFIENIVENFDDIFDELKGKLENTVINIFNKNNLLVNIVGNEKIYENSRIHIKKYVNKIPSNDFISTNSIKFIPKENNYSEAFYFDTLVQYVGLGYDIDEYSGSLLVLRHILNYDYLWNNIRVKGGAYGAGITINKYGEVRFWSYRDPNLTKTLENYFNISDYIKNIKLNDTELNKYIIGTLNTFDQLMSPVEKATISLNNRLTDSDVNLFDRLVNEIKNTKVSDLVNKAKLFDKKENNSYKCVVGSKEIIEKNRKLFSVVKELK